jgi:protease-4
MQLLNSRLKLIADASNVKGVLFVLQGLTGGSAKFQNLRRSIERLQSAGKECIVYTPYLDMGHYFLASAADRIIVPPSATFDALGLHSEALFLKDALARVGIEADVVQISPYKSAFDSFDKSDITPEMKEQLNWLLDESFDLLTVGMAAGRKMDQAKIQSLIDQAPLSASQAKVAGLVDDVAYEDALPFILAKVPDDDGSKENADIPAKEKEKRTVKPKAKLITWSQAAGMLMERPRRQHSKYIGVVSLEGSILMGPSRKPPIKLPIPLFGGTTAGEETLLRTLRGLEKNKKLAALILHVDSPGGSALASDLIWHQIQRIAAKKPVLTYMGNVAASGGYYVGAAANHIMAQSLTITGSIGVITMHLSTAGLYDKLNINRVTLNRGKRSMLFSDERPLNEEEYQALWDNIVTTYDQFKKVVSSGRGIDKDDLDPICEGRVWTGRQALDKNLIDSLGDFEDAVVKAVELAKLPSGENYHIPVYDVFSRGNQYLLPKALEPAEELIQLLSTERIRELNGRPLLLMPFDIRFH